MIKDELIKRLAEIERDYVELANQRRECKLVGKSLTRQIGEMLAVRYELNNLLNTLLEKEEGS